MGPTWSPASDALESSPVPTPSAIEFGTGGANCTLGTIATAFSAPDRIRLVGSGVFGGGDGAIVRLQSVVLRFKG